MHQHAQNLRHRGKSGNRKPEPERAESLESELHAQHAFLNGFRKHLAGKKAQGSAEAAAEKTREKGAEAEEHPQRREQEPALRRIVDKEQSAHAEREHIQEKQSEKPVEKRRRKSRADGRLTALHADVINFLDIAANIPGHEVVKEQSHEIEFEQMSVTQAHALTLKKQLPLIAPCEIRKAEARDREQNRHPLHVQEKRSQVTGVPARRTRYFRIDKIRGDYRHRALERENERRFHLRFHFAPAMR